MYIYRSDHLDCITTFRDLFIIYIWKKGVKEASAIFIYKMAAPPLPHIPPAHQQSLTD
jgi:hypothetical protein